MEPKPEHRKDSSVVTSQLLEDFKEFVLVNVPSQALKSLKTSAILCVVFLPVVYAYSAMAESIFNLLYPDIEAWTKNIVKSLSDRDQSFSSQPKSPQMRHLLPALLDLEADASLDYFYDHVLPFTYYDPVNGTLRTMDNNHSQAIALIITTSLLTTIDFDANNDVPFGAKVVILVMQPIGIFIVYVLVTNFGFVISTSLTLILNLSRVLDGIKKYRDTQTHFRVYYYNNPARRTDAFTPIFQMILQKVYAASEETYQFEFEMAIAALRHISRPKTGLDLGNSPNIFRAYKGRRENVAAGASVHRNLLKKHVPKKSKGFKKHNHPVLSYHRGKKVHGLSKVRNDANQNRRGLHIKHGDERKDIDVSAQGPPELHPFYSSIWQNENRNRKADCIKYGNLRKGKRVFTSPRGLPELQPFNKTAGSRQNPFVSTRSRRLRFRSETFRSNNRRQVPVEIDIGSRSQEGRGEKTADVVSERCSIPMITDHSSKQCSSFTGSERSRRICNQALDVTCRLKQSSDFEHSEDLYKLAYRDSFCPMCSSFTHEQQDTKEIVRPDTDKLGIEETSGKFSPNIMSPSHKNALYGVEINYGIGQGTFSRLQSASETTNREDLFPKSRTFSENVQTKGTEILSAAEGCDLHDEIFQFKRPSNSSCSVVDETKLQAPEEEVLCPLWNSGCRKYAQSSSRKKRFRTYSDHSLTTAERPLNEIFGRARNVEQYLTGNCSQSITYDNVHTSRSCRSLRFDEHNDFYERSCNNNSGQLDVNEYRHCSYHSCFSHEINNLKRPTKLFSSSRTSSDPPRPRRNDGSREDSELVHPVDFHSDDSSMKSVVSGKSHQIKYGLGAKSASPTFVDYNVRKDVSKAKQVRTQAYLEENIEQEKTPLCMLSDNCLRYTRKFPGQVTNFTNAPVVTTSGEHEKHDLSKYVTRIQPKNIAHTCPKISTQILRPRGTTFSSEFQKHNALLTAPETKPTKSIRNVKYVPNSSLFEDTAHHSTEPVESISSKCSLNIDQQITTNTTDTSTKPLMFSPTTHVSVISTVCVNTNTLPVDITKLSKERRTSNALQCEKSTATLSVTDGSSEFSSILPVPVTDDCGKYRDCPVPKAEIQPHPKPMFISPLDNVLITNAGHATLLKRRRNLSERISSNKNSNNTISMSTGETSSIFYKFKTGSRKKTVLRYIPFKRLRRSLAATNRMVWSKNNLWSMLVMKHNSMTLNPDCYSMCSLCFHDEALKRWEIETFKVYVFRPLESFIAALLLLVTILLATVYLFDELKPSPVKDFIESFHDAFATVATMGHNDVISNLISMGSSFIYILHFYILISWILLAAVIQIRPTFNVPIRRVRAREKLLNCYKDTCETPYCNILYGKKFMYIYPYDHDRQYCYLVDVVKKKPVLSNQSPHGRFVIQRPNKLSTEIH